MVAATCVGYKSQNASAKSSLCQFHLYGQINSQTDITMVWDRLNCGDYIKLPTCKARDVVVAGSSSSSAQDILTHFELSHVNSNLLPYRPGAVRKACGTGISCIRFEMYLLSNFNKQELHKNYTTYCRWWFVVRTLVSLGGETSRWCDFTFYFQNVDISDAEKI